MSNPCPLFLTAVTSVGQLLPYYSTHFLPGYSKAQIAWIGSVQPLMVFSPAVLTGRFFDVHGARIQSVSGTLIAFGAIVALSFSKEYYQLLLSHLTFGIAGGLVYAPSTAVAGHWFLKRRSTAVGIIVGGSGLGGVIYPICMKVMLDRLSFRNTMLIIAGCNLLLMAPGCVWMKARLPPKTPPPWRMLLRPWHDLRFVFLVLSCSTYGFNLLTGYFNAPTLSTGNKLSANLIAYSVAILQAGSFIGRIGYGMIADRFGVGPVFGSLAFSTAATYYAFWIANTGPVGTCFGLFLFGCFSGAWFTLAASATAHISPPEELGSRIGMMWTSIAIPVLIGPVISGYLVSAAGESRFTYAGIFAGTTMLISGLLYVAPHVWRLLKPSRDTSAA